MNIYVGKNKSLGVDVVCGEYAYSNALFGVVEFEAAGGMSAISVFGLSIFERVGDISVLFGVSWL